MHHPFLFFALPLATLGSFTYLTVAKAQITPDNSLGAENSVVTPNVQIKDTPSDRIDGGAIRGDNLFHSFQEFNINAGRGAYFSNPSGIANILTRVTGINPSNIQGVLGVLGSANLFLINPNGIIFGPNARLDMGGSFLGSTANSLIFKNNFEFSATNPQAPPLLTINVPIGLRYRDNPQPIQVTGSGHGRDFSDFTDRISQNIDPNVTGLQVEPGKTLALVGGNVSVEGGVLRSPGGRIEIGSFDSNQVVNLVPAQSEGFSLAYQGTPSFRNIEFSKKSLANVTGDGSGSIAIKGRTINFNSESILLANTLGDKNGGEISIVGDSINFNRSGVFSNTFSSGDSGRIKLDATNNIEFKDSSTLTIQTWDKGKAGDININANSLGMEPGSALVSLTTEDSTGNAGDINVTAEGITLTGGINTDSNGTGKAGTININANSLQMDNSRLTSSAVKDKGQAGEINITAGSLATNITTIITNTYNTGDGGIINIKANSFQFKGNILSETQNSKGPDGEEKISTGRGGKININAGSLEVLQIPPDTTVISTKTFSQGDAGNINITVTGPLTVAGGAIIKTDSSGNGNAKAGDLKISADTIKLDNSSLNADTNGGQGNISVNSRDLILRNNGKITTNATGTVNGGNIEINNTGNLVVFEDSKITANAEKGNGGTVKITARGIFRYPDSITATSEAGPQFNGIVQFNTPDVDPTRGLFELSETVIDPAQQIAQNVCTKGFGSSFTITGRGGFPSDPTKILSSDNVRVDLVKPVPSTVSSTSATQKQPSKSPTVKEIIPARGWIFNEKGEVLLVGYDPTKTGPQRKQPAPTSSCAAVK